MEEQNGDYVAGETAMDRIGPEIHQGPQDISRGHKGAANGLNLKM